MAAGNDLATASIAASISCQLIVVSVAPAEPAAALAEPPTISEPVIPDAAWPAIWQIIV